MLYKTELHCHTSDVSHCGKASAAEAVDFYLAHGYTTVVLTNHLNKKTFDNPRFGDQSGWDWETRVRFFFSGVEKMREAAAGRLIILPGCEYRSFTNPSDFQLYGVTEEFLLAHPNLMEMKIKEVSPLAREAGILFVQAHPFRDGMQITKPELLDGIEVWNGNLGHGNRNEFAELWAQKFGLIRTGGTDFHAVKPGKMPVGILTEYPVTSNEVLLQTLRAGTYTLMKNRISADGITEELQ